MSELAARRGVIAFGVMMGSVVLAWAGAYILSGLVAAVLLGWLAWQVVGRAPTHEKRPGLGPLAWSSYDRRRSGRGRPGVVRWLARRARRRARRMAGAGHGYGAGEQRPVPPGWSSSAHRHPGASPGSPSERFREPDVR